MLADFRAARLVGHLKGALALTTRQRLYSRPSRDPAATSRGGLLAQHLIEEFPGLGPILAHSLPKQIVLPDLFRVPAHCEQRPEQ
jgi:hypothetical protein